MKCNKCGCENGTLTVLGVCSDGYRCEMRHSDQLCERIDKLEAQLAQAEMKLDRTTALFIKAEAKLAMVGEELVNNGCDCDFDDLELLPKCLACRIEYILSDQRKVLAVQEIPPGYTLLSLANDKQDHIVFGEVEDGGTVIVLGKEEE